MQSTDRVVQETREFVPDKHPYNEQDNRERESYYRNTSSSGFGNQFPAYPGETRLNGTYSNLFETGATRRNFAGCYDDQVHMKYKTTYLDCPHLNSSGAIPTDQLLEENEILRKRIFEVESMANARLNEVPDEVVVLQNENNHLKSVSHSRLAEIEEWKRLLSIARVELAELIRQRIEQRKAEFIESLYNELNITIETFKNEIEDLKQRIREEESKKGSALKDIETMIENEKKITLTITNNHEAKFKQVLNDALLKQVKEHSEKVSELKKRTAETKKQFSQAEIDYDEVRAQMLSSFQALKDTHQKEIEDMNNRIARKLHEKEMEFSKNWESDLGNLRDYIKKTNSELTKSRHDHDATYSNLQEGYKRKIADMNQLYEENIKEKKLALIQLKEKHAKELDKYRKEIELQWSKRIEDAENKCMRIINANNNLRKEIDLNYKLISDEEISKDKMTLGEMRQKEESILIKSKEAIIAIVDGELNNQKSKIEKNIDRLQREIERITNMQIKLQTTVTDRDILNGEIVREKKSISNREVRGGARDLITQELLDPNAVGVFSKGMNSVFGAGRALGFDPPLTNSDAWDADKEVSPKNGIQDQSIRPIMNIFKQMVRRIDTVDDDSTSIMNPEFKRPPVFLNLIVDE